MANNAKLRRELAFNEAALSWALIELGKDLVIPIEVLKQGGPSGEIEIEEKRQFLHIRFKQKKVMP